MAHPFEPGRNIVFIGTSSNGTGFNADNLCWDDGADGAVDTTKVASQPIVVGATVLIDDPDSDGGTVISNVTSGTPTFTGAATPNTTITFTDGLGHTATETSPDNGNWSFTVPVSWGWTTGNTYTLTSSIPSGGTTITSATTVTVVTPTVSITTPSGAPATVTTLTPTVSGAATGVFTLTQTSPSVPANTATITPSGGTWSYTIPSGWGWVDGGTYTLTATIDGGSDATKSLTIAIPVTPTVSITTPSGAPATVTTVTPAVSGAASEVFTLTQTSPSGSGNTATITPSGGIWNYTIPSEWGWVDGQTYTLTATIVGGSDATKSIKVEIPITPDAPEITFESPADHASVLTTTPTITGTVTAEATFTLTDGDSTITVTDNGDNDSDPDPGEWTVTLPLNWVWLIGENYTLTASVTVLDETTTATHHLRTETDLDSDGVADSKDNCPFTGNPTQIDGDGNGVGNICDYGGSAQGVAQKSIAGLQAAGSGCSFHLFRENNNGLGIVLVTAFIGFLLRRRKSIGPVITHFAQWSRFASAGALGLLLVIFLIQATPSFAEGEGDLDVEQFDALVPGAGVLNQPYGRVDAIPGWWNVGFSAQYAHQPLKLIKINPDETREEGPVIPGLFRYEFMGRARLGPYFDFQTAFPIVDGMGTPTWTIGGRSVEDLQALTLGDLRFSIGADLIRLWTQEKTARSSGPGVALRMTSWIPMGGATALHGESALRLEPRLAIDYKLDRLHFGGSLGYLIRQESEIFHIVNGNAFRWGTFARGPLTSETDWVGTVFGSYQTQLQIDPADATLRIRSSNYNPMEAMGGLESKFGKYTTLVALGSGLNGAVGAPSWRALFQISFYTENPDPASWFKRKAAEPVPPPLPSVEPVYFEVSQHNFVESEKLKLDQLVAALKSFPDKYSVMLEGHTDIRGSEEMNLQLSRMRALTVRDYLVTQGIPAERLDIKGFGKQRPLSTRLGDMLFEWSRRVEIQITR